MGIQSFGFPSRTVEWLQRNMKIDTFIEAGTFMGGSAKEAANLFDKVITIEKSQGLYLEAQKNLAIISNIKCYYGCTRDHVVSHLLPKDRPLFWLDAHWSGGKTAGEDDECPILDELALIFDKELDDYAVLIDDARLFVCPPPYPHNRKCWPNLARIAKLIPDSYSMYIYDDVVYILPPSISDDFSGFLQSVIAKTSQYEVKSTKANTIRRIFSFLSGNS